MEFGKFRDATSLLDGYINLEKAYTKKCQEANELKKQLGEKSTQETGKASETFESLTPADENKALKEAGAKNLSIEEKEQGAEAGEDLEQSESACDTNRDTEVESRMGEGEIYNKKIERIGLDEAKQTDDKSDKNARFERFKRPEWRKSVAKFFALNPEARGLKSEISKVILSDSSLQTAENCLELAYLKVKENRPASNFGETSLIEQPATKTQALENEVDPTKEITLSEYLKLVAERKVNAPKFLTDAIGSRTIGLTPQKKIGSLAEAGEYLMKNYFK